MFHKNVLLFIRESQALFEFLMMQAEVEGNVEFANIAA